MDAWLDSFLNGSIELTVLFRVALSVVLGFILGLERELYKRPAGLRTHILVCIASCLIMMVSVYGFDEGDPARLAAQVVSGVGFLGAGAIMREDKGNGIKGITTAATIWMSAMIGLACGNGFYFGAVVVTVSALVILTILRNFETKIAASSKYKSKVFMILKDTEDLMVGVRSFLQEGNLQISDIDTKIVNFDGEKAMRISITFERNSSLNSLYEFVDKIEKNYETLQIKLSYE